MRAHFTNRTSRARRHGAGMTLVEVLVTLVIISVGLLGVAALQLTTVRNNHDAFIRSQAALLASDMLDRIRANREAALNGEYNGGYGTLTGTTTAIRDMNEWKATLSTQLSEGDGSVSTLLVAGTLPQVVIVTINVRWGERGEANPLVFTTSSQI